MLISNLELIAKTVAWDSVNKDAIMSNAQTIETKLFMDCLGVSFRDKMELDKIDYKPARHSDAKVYNTGDIAEYNNRIYISLIDENADYVTEELSWQLAPKFNTEIYNKLWDSGMCEWIANNILALNLSSITYPLSGKGLTKHFEDSGQRTVDTRELNTVRRELENIANISYKVMMAFIDQNYLELDLKRSVCGQNNDCLAQDSERIAW